ncbi:MAG: lipoyl(octanoyl) transferase LipB [Acidobacteriaceae bacterium]
MILNLLQIGRVPYTEGLELQRRLVAERHADRIGNTLVLLEHPPVLTLGRNASRAHILASNEFLASQGIEVHEINRGGDVTYHGPGQLVGYPIFDLRSYTPRLGAVDFVRRIEEALIRACGDFGVPATRIPGRTGVWTLAGGTIQEKKVAAIGIHIARGITSHGFALNVNPDLRDFELIVPCGIADRSVTSLELEAGQESDLSPSMETVRNAVARQFGRVFELPVLAAETLSDLLPESPTLSAAAADL